MRNEEREREIRAQERFDATEREMATVPGFDREDPILPTSQPPRTRYAPSPTGFFHIGGARTALFAWLFARKYGGEFIIRIEDTDTERTIPGAVEDLMQGLAWLGLDIDEGPDVGGNYGPYYQTQRVQIYHEYAQELLDKGWLYPCYCSPERLEAVRQEQMKNKQPPGYDRHCRNLTPEQRAEYEAQGIKPVLRLRVPEEGETSFVDQLRGLITVENRNLNDMVMLKSNGLPVYHFAVVVDDHLMQITHIIRGDEWIATTPYLVMLYDAFDWDMPELVHLPKVLGWDKKKLSKRNGDTAVRDYKAMGYLPEAIINFLALLGWSLNATDEIFSIDDLKRDFSLDRLVVNDAIFNMQKLDWYNGYYIRKLDNDQLARLIVPFLAEAGLINAQPDGQTDQETFESVKRMVPLIQERLKVPGGHPATPHYPAEPSVVELTEFFFTDTLDYDAAKLIGKGMNREQALDVLRHAQTALEQMESFDEPPVTPPQPDQHTCPKLEGALRPLVEETGLKPGQVFGTLRVAVTGRTVSPPLFDTMAVLGKQRSLDRLAAAIRTLEAA